MDARQLLVEFLRELDAAEAPLERQEPLLKVKQLFYFYRSLLFSKRRLLFSKRRLLLVVPNLGILGVESAESAGTFSKLYLRAFPRIMRARVREEKWVQIWKYFDLYG